MGQLLLYALLAGTSVAAIARPWIGVVAGYVFVVLGPQHIWWWNFQGIRPFFIVTIPTMIGLALWISQGKIDFSVLKTKFNLGLAVFWLFVNLSYIFGPYVNAGPGPQFHSPADILDRVNKMYIFYFIAVLCIRDKKQFKYLSMVMIFSITYLIYWANDQYLSGLWRGRLGGPRSLTGGHYTDENGFAMLFVMGIPFLLYLGYYFKNWILRYSIWLIIPLGWHAVFLTGSRGGLVGLGITMIAIALRSKKKMMSLGLILALIVAYQWQAGDVMKERAGTIQEYEEESSAQTRFQAWAAAWGMMKAHPVFGVGIVSFGNAFPVFSPHKPRVAHNSYFQIGAESGFIALFAYLFVAVSSIRFLWKNNFPPEDPEKDKNSYWMYLMGEALLISLIGFLSCSLFLSMNINEIHLYLVLLIQFIYTSKKRAVFNAEKTL